MMLACVECIYKYPHTFKREKGTDYKRFKTLEITIVVLMIKFLAMIDIS